MDRNLAPPAYAGELETALRAGTAAEVRFDDGARALWSTDASNYRHVPIGVVLPRTIDDLIGTVVICRRFNAPITTRGGGTSLAGQACNAAVIVDCSRHLNRILDIDVAAKRARVEPGVILDALRDAARPHGLTFGPDPATHSRCTIGGMIANNSCGAHSVMAQFFGPGPLTRHQVIELDILTVDGERFTVGATDADAFAEVMRAGGRRADIDDALRALRDRCSAEVRRRFTDIPRRVSGFNLDALLPEHGFNLAHALVGTEGTCAIILGATLQLIDDLPGRALLVLGYADAFQAADHVPALMNFRPVALEGMDDTLIEMMRTRGTNHAQLDMLPPGRGWLMCEFGGMTAADAMRTAEAAMALIASTPDAPAMRLCRNDTEARQLWAVREAALGIAARHPKPAPAREARHPEWAQAHEGHPKPAPAHEARHPEWAQAHEGHPEPAPAREARHPEWAQAHEGHPKPAPAREARHPEWAQAHEGHPEPAPAHEGHPEPAPAHEGRHPEWAQAHEGHPEPAPAHEARHPEWAQAHEGWEDSAVPPSHLGRYLRDLRALLDRYGYHSAMYGHFGQGCVHFRIDFDLHSTEGVAHWRRFLDDASDLVVAYGGSLSGEHGDGQARAIYLEKMYGAEIVSAFREFKAIWDPMNLLNPGKVVDPRLPDQDLRMGPDYMPRAVTTHFAYRDDGGDFAAATARCVGVGACRREHGGTMCPSYMVTRDEEHSTRGRARLLFEMMSNGVITDGWQSDAVKRALDLCLACKACKTECPVNVDMATYKAEFLSHYYEQHARPRAAHTMGRIHCWARIASPFAPIVNVLAAAPVVGSLMKRAAGIAPARRIPAFASTTLRNHAKRQQAAPARGKRVLLWPDTFTNYLRTSAGIAALDVLRHAGYDVALPPDGLCCGRPLYDWGMLREAKELWRATLDKLRDEIRAGTPIVGLEPSCVAAFRDELPGLFPDDPDAERLSRQVFLLPEFLVAEGYVPPRLDAHAVVHMHCHQRAVIGTSADMQLLASMGVTAELLDSGCCGMAGAFGFEADKYDVSVAAAERVLMPAVRAADPDTLIITNGFSCQEQIAQLSDRRALHIAEVIAMSHPEP